MKNKKFIELLPIETDNLILRKCKAEDASLLLEMDRDENVQRFLGGIKETSIEDRKKYIFKKQKVFLEGIVGLLTLEVKNLNGPIGFINFSINEDENKALLSYIISHSFWNKGFCTEISKKLVEIGFNVLELSEVTANTVSGNMASAKVLEKIGMHMAGSWVKNEVVNNESKKVKFIDYRIVNNKVNK